RRSAAPRASGTWRSWSSCTRRGYACPSCPAWTSRMWTGPERPCACWARDGRSGSSPSAAGPRAPSTPTSGRARSGAGRSSPTTATTFLATTVVAVRHRGQVALAGDGQVSIGNTIVKASAKKVRKLYQDRVLAGFAGTAADAFTLFARFESRLEEHRGNLARAAVEVAKDWRTDRVLRRLEALLAVADREHSFIISGNGDVIEPDDGLIG